MPCYFIHGNRDFLLGKRFAKASGMTLLPEEKLLDLYGRKVLIMHGWDDPMATPDQVISLAEELTAMGADWQIHGYGNTMHAFTNPAASDAALGTVYDADADRRSWQSLQLFLAEIF